jgi:hypothetical protein
MAISKTSAVDRAVRTMCWMVSSTSLPGSRILAVLASKSE